MRQAYLTIDDGPSEKFRLLVDFLKARGVPAVFFNRGDNMQARPEDVIYGIRHDFIMANHAYSHQRASRLSFADICADILRAEAVLDRLYKEAGVKRPGKYFRFPYMDRGMGPSLVEPGRRSPAHEEGYNRLVTVGLGHALVMPDEAMVEKKRALQEFLKEEGFENLPVRGVTIPWYAQTEMAEGVDSLCTFSTSDWALSARHIGKHGFSNLEDLRVNIDQDKDLQNQKSRHIILAHDQAEIHDVTTALVDHFLDRGVSFLDFHERVL
jgi:peptidoglycan/xylan/chitin deacetylase (PgdA/CDA1 family)